MIFMAKFADYNNLDRWKDHILDALSDKSRSTHRHALVNGKRVVVSDTVPTVNDENVITLIVNTVHVPDVGGLTVETVGYITKIFSFQAFLGMSEAHYTMQAYLDDEPVEALYQAEIGSNPDIIVPYSSKNTFDTFVGTGVKIRVKYNDYEKLFDVSFVDPDSEVKSSRIPNLDFSDDTKTSGFFKSSGEYISGAITYEEASEGMRLVWHWQDGFDGSDFSTILVERIVDVNGDLSLADPNVDEMLSHFIRETRGNAIITSTEAYIDINETFTEDDISEGAVYLMSATANDGTEYYSYLSQSLKGVPSTEHFADYVTRCAFNSSYTNDTTNDNQLTHVSSSYSAVYFCFDLEKEFAYDIEIRLTDNSGVPLKQSTKVPFDACPEVITVEAGSKTKKPYCRHKIGTAGTYYVIANITGVGTNYEQDILIELTVT